MKSAGIIGLVLCLPGILFFTLLLIPIEPNFGPFSELLTSPTSDEVDMLGSFIILTSIIILPLLALGLNIFALGRLGNSISSHPSNLAVCLLALAMIVGFVVAFSVDQYPCWLGVPNCG